MESKYGEIEEMNICDNLSEHLAGNFEKKANKFENFQTNFRMTYIFTTHSKWFAL